MKMLPSDDATLIVLAQGGDRRALERLVRKHLRAVKRMCGSLHGGDDQTEDVVQETFVAILRNLGSFRGEASFTTWVYTLARTQRGRAHRATARHRARVRGLYESVRWEDEGQGDLDDALVRKEILSSLERALAPLGPVDRKIAVMRDVEGRSAAEIASTVGLTVPAVRTRLHRARATIRRQLAPSGGPLSPRAEVSEGAARVA